MTTIGIDGGLTVDHLITQGSGARFSCLGGPGLFAALGARIIAGTQVRLHAALPDDEPRFEALFRATGVDTRFSRRSSKTTRLWILNSTEGRRILPTRSPDGLELVGTQLDVAALTHAAPDAFYTGLDGLLLSSPPLSARTTERAPVVGVDPDQRAAMKHGLKYWKALAEGATVLLPSRVQLRQLNENPKDAALLLSRTTKLPVIARLDAEGLLVIDREQAWRVHDPSVKVVDTIGAGDASAAAIVAALAGGSDLADAAAFGASAARLVLSDWGHNGLLRDEPLLRPFETITTKEL